MAIDVQRELPTPESIELLDLVRQIARTDLAPVASQYEADGQFPREVFRKLGDVGLLGLPYPTALGGADQPFTVYLQVIEELASAWLSVALGVSVHTLSGLHAGHDRWLAFRGLLSV